MKKLDITKNEIAPLLLLLISLPLLFIGILLKSMMIIGGVAGLMIAWFLCIDHFIANHKMNVIKRIVFGSIIIIVPVLFVIYLGS